MSVEVAEMSVPAADDAHEFVVAPELAEVAECLAVPLRTGDRVRFDLIEHGADEGVATAWADPSPPMTSTEPSTPVRSFERSSAPSDPGRPRPDRRPGPPSATNTRPSI
jgi:hypothetical protein